MRTIFVALVAALAIGCGSATGGTSTSGLQGLVMRGPTTPVCRVNEPCEEPAPNVKLTFYRSGKAVAQVKTNAKGRYRIGLRPGTYSVRTNATFGKVPSPSRARVPRGRYARVVFHIDTGIR
jgi:hypothetical protein